jgi:hypothetical protein
VSLDDDDYIASSERDEVNSESKTLTDIKVAKSAKAKTRKGKFSCSAAHCPNKMTTVANAGGMKNHGTRSTSFGSEELLLLAGAFRILVMQSTALKRRPT